VLLFDQLEHKLHAGDEERWRMARQQEGFFADYDEGELEQQATLTFTQRELVLIRTALGILLEDTSRHDHIFNDIHALLSKLPRAPQRKRAVSDRGAEPPPRREVR
jgi:hypothetical protein